MVIKLTQLSPTKRLQGPRKKARLSWGKGRDTEHAYTLIRLILLKHLEMKKTKK